MSSILPLASYLLLSIVPLQTPASTLEVLATQEWGYAIDCTRKHSHKDLRTTNGLVTTAEGHQFQLPTITTPYSRKPTSEEEAGLADYFSGATQADHFRLSQ